MASMAPPVSDQRDDADSPGALTKTRNQTTALPGAGYSASGNVFVGHGNQQNGHNFVIYNIYRDCLHPAIEEAPVPGPSGQQAQPCPKKCRHRLYSLVLLRLLRAIVRVLLRRGTVRGLRLVLFTLLSLARDASV